MIAWGHSQTIHLSKVWDFRLFEAVILGEHLWACSIKELEPFRNYISLRLTWRPNTIQTPLPCDLCLLSHSLCLPFHFPCLAGWQNLHISPTGSWWFHIICASYRIEMILFVINVERYHRISEVFGARCPAGLLCHLPMLHGRHLWTSVLMVAPGSTGIGSWTARVDFLASRVFWEPW